MNEREIFTAAVEIRDAEAQVRFLDQACAGDLALRERVDRLLNTHRGLGEHGEPFATPPIAISPQAIIEAMAHAHPLSADAENERSRNSSSNEALQDLPAGTMCGPYKLLEIIGRGGMGSVWMAEQLEPIRRRVAIKVIHPGMDSRAVLARFEAERQALALMDHTNIAKVLDAGATPDGRPYFVMELVMGIPFTKYCDENRLNVRQRLELFAQTCRGVQHAHQKGIIHRDMKPANILVAEYDGHPTIKIIDFGIAKATGERLTEKTLFTQFGQVVGTLEYMSPEQARLNQLDIDTRSDIYSLGVVLYELLTGSPPFERQRLKEAAFDEVLRMIREEDPPRPSDRLSTSQTLPAIAANRAMEPARLSRMLRGDLDWVVGKALEKDRDRRYASALDLAGDIELFLADRPVLAGPPTLRNRLTKYIRRHRNGVVATAVVLLTLMGGLASTSFSLVRARRERDAKDVALRAEKEARQRAEAAENQARTALDALTDEWVENRLAVQPKLTQADRKFLQSIVRQYETYGASLADRPAALAAKSNGLRRIGLIYSRLGDLEQAATYLAQTEETQRQIIAAAPDNPDDRMVLGNTLCNLGNVFLKDKRRVEAEAKYRESIALFEQLVEEFPRNRRYREFLASAIANLGVLLKDLNRNTETMEKYRESVQISRQLAEEFPKDAELWAGLAATQGNLGIELIMAGQADDSIATFQESAEHLKRATVLEPDNAEYRLTYIRTLGNLGMVYGQLGRFTAAEETLQTSVEEATRLVSEFPAVPDYRESQANYLGQLGQALLAQDRTDQALQRFHEATVIQERLIADFPKTEHYRSAAIRMHEEFGESLAERGHVDRSGNHFLAAARLVAQSYPRLSDAKSRDQAVERFLKMLRAAQKSRVFADPAQRESLMTDPDFEPIRNVPEVQTWIQSMSLPSTHDGNHDESVD